MTIAKGIEKKLVIALQTAKGTIAAVNAASAIYLRRTSSTLDFKKETYQSNEMRTDKQVADFRHGVRSVDGTIAGELAPGSYQLLMAAIMRKAWAAGGVSSAEIDVTAAPTTGAEGTFTQTTGSYITDGFKVGDVVRWSGFAGGTATNNNAHNFLITGLTALVMTGVMLDGVPVVADAAGDSVTVTVVGKKLWIPATGHTDDYFTIEHNYSDLDLSEVFTDCKVNSMAVKLSATGMATIDFGMMGLDMVPKTSANAPYFTSPAAAGTAGVVAAVNGAIYVQGVKVALITGMDFNVAANLSSEPVVGSNVKPEIFSGKSVVTGNMTVFFEDATFRDYFINETEVSINVAFTTSNAANADFLAISLPRVKVGGASKDDGEKGLIQTMPFTALFNTAGGAAVNTEATTISIQDSTVA
ncbi:MAG: hypothetical protein CVU54_01875 [Deltaproteobacteria bacterium HGW-Deltaproteobacteria-12]|jgi:hypothetical protein|nr:MAG: hypothetical protein CVU54_01875 [Deltaproteobacteria bacterium HGW-Deltaproteobacteria-12]